MNVPQWQPSVNQLAQCSHFFIAATIILACRLLDLHSVIAAWVLIGWALPKEFLFDLIVERDSVDSSMKDFLWYIGGGFATMIAIYLTKGW